MNAETTMMDVASCNLCTILDCCKNVNLIIAAPPIGHSVQV